MSSHKDQMDASDAVQPEASIVAGSDREKDTFCFLNLPAEVRALVYDLETDAYAINNFVHNQPAGTQLEFPETSTYFVIRTINLNLRLVNKTIKGEVDRRIAAATMPATFIFEELDPETYQWIMPAKFPKTMVPNIRHAVFKITAWCRASSCTGTCVAQHDVDGNHFYAQSVVSKLPNLRSCEVELDVECRRDDDSSYPNIEHGANLIESIHKLAEIDKITRIKVYKLYSDEEDLPIEELLWACWNESQGFHRPSIEEEAEGRFNMGG